MAGAELYTRAAYVEEVAPFPTISSLPRRRGAGPYPDVSNQVILYRCPVWLV